MEFKINRISRQCSVAILATGAFAALAGGSEPDTSQFGFLSSGGQAGGASTGIMRADTARTQEVKPAEAQENSEDGVPGNATPESKNIIPEWMHFGLAVQSLYDDNIYLASDHAKGAWVNRITPILRVGNTVPDAAVWMIDGVYSPVWTTYASSSGRDSFDQAVAATVRYNGTRLKATTSASYQETSGNDRFIRDLFTTVTSRGQAQLNYDLTGRTSLETRLLWEKIDRQDTGSQIYNDDRTVSLQISALWRATAITKIGPAVRIGTTSSTLSPDRTFVDALVRVEYDSAAFLKFSLQGGAQWISFDGDRGSYWRPSVTLTGQYDINPLWQLIVSAYSRSSAAPDLLNSDIQATGFNGFLRWKPMDSLQVSAGAGYERARYEFFDDSPDRLDDYTYGELLVKAGRENSPLAVELFYRHRLCDSSADGQDFANNQAGVQLSRRF